MTPFLVVLEPVHAFVGQQTGGSADATHLGFIYTFSCHGPGSVILCVYVFGLLIIVYLIL